MSMPMTFTPRGRSTAQRLAVLSTVLIAATTGIPSTAHAEHSGPAAAPSSLSPAPQATIDAHDPDLQLPQYSRLAKPKILTLDQRKLGLIHIVTNGTASPPPQPKPFPTQHPLHPHEPSRSSATPATPSPTGMHDSPRPTATPTPDGRATSAPTAQEQHRPLLRTALGLLALLAALVLGRFALRTRRRGRKDQPSPRTRATASAAQPSATPPHGTARLDSALRALAQHAREAGQELPQLRAARITVDSLAVLPVDEALAPPPPFTHGDDSWWHLPADADLMEEHTAHTPPAPYPALATIGTTTLNGHEALLLLNLAYPQAVLLEGNPTDVEEVLTALTLELITSPWNNAVDLITTGFGQDLPHPPPGPRATYLPQAADAVQEMSERLLEAAQHPHPELRPHLLLSTHPLHDELAARTAELAHKATPLPLTLIAPAGNGTTRHFPQATVLNASHHEPQHLHRLATSVTLQRLTRSDYLQAITALTACDNADLAEQHSPPAGDDSASRTAEPAARQPATASTNAADHAAPAESSHKTNEADAAFPVLRANPPTRGTLDADAASASDHRADFFAPVTSTTSRRAVEMPEEDATTGTSIRIERHETASTETGAPGQGPEIRVLGPVEVTGVRPSGHGPRIAQLAALLYFKPGRTADELCTHMDPTAPWTPATLNARLHGLRRALGDDPQGRPYVPRRSAGDTPYRLSPAIHCDWTHFHSLTEHPLHHAPAGLQNLEQALTLVRGKPFGGRPLPWAEPLAQEMTTRIVDVAHTIAVHRTAHGPHHDLSKARRAIACALDIDDTAELLYRDWLRLEAAAANRSGLHTVISRLQHLTHTLNAPLQPQTEQLITELLHTTQPHSPTS
ncbi:bacterial transcriptional activator domain-containing protein [Streptomyces levis]